MTTRPPADTSLDARLVSSVEERRKVIARFGMVPNSVLKLHRGALSKSLFNLPAEKERGVIRLDQATLDDTKSEASRAIHKDRLAAGLIGGGGLGPSQQRERVSMMAAELVEFVLAFYGEPGGTYLDPFAGQGVQAQVAWLKGFRYVAMDASAEYVDYTRRVVDLLPDTEFDVPRPVVHHGDSRHPVDVPDGIGTVGFTSPPYWDTEYYGPEPFQLGVECVDYDQFMDGMRAVYEAWLPKFVSGAYLVVNVNDFRRAGRFHPYHADTITALDRAGWSIHDVWVVEGLVTGLARVFAVDKINSMIAPKVHEYLIVAHKK
jgi:hypothetical protein